MKFKAIREKIIKNILLVGIVVFHLGFVIDVGFVSFYITTYCYKSDNGFEYSANLVGIAFTLFGFAITAKNILNYKNSEYFINVPIKTIVYNSATDLYYLCWFNIAVSPLFMLVGFCIYSEINLTLHVLLSFISFVVFLRLTYQMISLKNTEKTLSAMLLRLTLESQSEKNENLRKNILSSLFIENRKNISSSDYILVFNEYIKNTLKIISGTYTSVNKFKNMSAINKEVDKLIFNKRRFSCCPLRGAKRIVTDEAIKFINTNIAIFVFDYLNFTLKDCKSKTKMHQINQDDLIDIDIIIKNLIDVIFDKRPHPKKEILIYEYYINSISGLLLAVLKNTDITFFENICSYIKEKLSDKQTSDYLQKFYLLGYFNAVICAVIDYNILNNIIPSDTQLTKTLEIYAQYMSMCNRITFTNVLKMVSNGFNLKYSNEYGDFKKVVYYIQIKLIKYDKKPLFLDKVIRKG